MRLNNKTIDHLPEGIEKPLPETGNGQNHILHIGVGGFHRAHQAYAWHQLRQKYPGKYKNWCITGICLMPSDRELIRSLKEQDYLYILKMCAANGEERVQVIDCMKEIWYGEEHRALIIDRIAHQATKVISFTITEGGYNMDYEQHKFFMQDPAIQHDLHVDNDPKTVFGYLARGLFKRMVSGGSHLVLMSCDNIPQNGEILRFALLSFLAEYDGKLKTWAEEHIHFPNSMVDRITPVTRVVDKQEFEKQYGVRDDALVVSEDYFQWVLEDKGLAAIPPLDEIGVELVSDVHPYEAMKLGLLNAGHSLVGLVGDMLGYTKIHDAVRDEQISSLFDRYAENEAIPVLQPIDRVDFSSYYNTVKTRFSNPMINDSTERIISGSSDKIPKFLLPIVRRQLQQENPNTEISALVIAAWWSYLSKAYRMNRMEQVVDNRKDQLLDIFKREASSARQFLEVKAIFGELGANATFRDQYLNYTDGLAAHDVRQTFNRIIK